MKNLRYLVIGAALVPAVFGQSQVTYPGSDATGKLTLMTTTNLMQKATSVQSSGVGLLGPQISPGFNATRLQPPITNTFTSASISDARSIPVAGSNSFGFNGMTHLDQRNANSGNQFNTEPAMPAVAIGNGYVLQTVGNAIQVYNTGGVNMLPKVITFNQLFGLAPSIDRTTNLMPGPFLTDMRCFYDQDINRWFIVARAQLNDTAGNKLPQSRIYLAVSQTPDPTGTYNSYVIDSTNAQKSGCPCIADYLQIGADRYGFYISANEFNTFSVSFVDGIIFAVSKSSLAAGAPMPTMYQFQVPSFAGFGFSIQPATTPPGGTPYLASNGVEFFVSSISNSTAGSSLAVWAMTNTASLNTANPSLSLIQIYVPTQTYLRPTATVQLFGSFPLASGFFPFIPPSLDGGDLRVLSLSYTGGRLFATLATQLVDENGRIVVGGAYFILSPAIRGNTLMTSVYRQGYIMVKNNSLLRSFIAVNSAGRGAVVFTLVGRDYFPSLAFVPIDTFSTGSTVQLVAPGANSEDGFTGAVGSSTWPIARWGDDSGAAAASDGSIWMTVEYIPNLPRTDLANWGTFLARYIP